TFLHARTRKAMNTLSRILATLLAPCLLLSVREGHRSAGVQRRPPLQFSYSLFSSQALAPLPAADAAPFRAAHAELSRQATQLSMPGIFLENRLTDAKFDLSKVTSIALLNVTPLDVKKRLYESFLAKRITMNAFIVWVGCHLRTANGWFEDN